MFEMAGWRCLRCLGKATADGVWPAVGHSQGVIGLRRDGDTLGISFDVARVCELVGVDADVAVMVVCNHSNKWMPIVGVQWISWAEVVVDGVKKGVSIEGVRVDGVLAAGGVICGECLDAGVKIMFVGGSKVVRVRSRVVGMGLVEVLVKSIA